MIISYLPDQQLTHLSADAVSYYRIHPSTLFITVNGTKVRVKDYTVQKDGSVRFTEISEDKTKTIKLLPDDLLFCKLTYFEIEANFLQLELYDLFMKISYSSLRDDLAKISASIQKQITDQSSKEPE